MTKQSQSKVTRTIEYRELLELRPDPRNPKSHALETLDESIGRFGVVDPIVLDGRTGYIISGHGRAKTLEAMRERSESPPEGVSVSLEGSWLVPVSVGWSSRTDSEAAAALIALNRTTELGGWVDEALLDLLEGMDEEEDLVGVGFTPEDVTDLRDHLDELNNYNPEDDGAGREHAIDVGERVELLAVTFGEPGQAVEHGQIWAVGRHLLIIAELAHEHPIWSPHLEGRVFAPYPEPYLTLSTIADEQDLLMVQPNKFLAGHLLDAHRQGFPEEIVEVWE